MAPTGTPGASAREWETRDDKVDCKPVEPSTIEEPRETDTDKLEDSTVHPEQDTGAAQGEHDDWYETEANFPLLGVIAIALGSFGLGFVVGRCSVGR